MPHQKKKKKRKKKKKKKGQHPGGRRKSKGKKKQCLGGKKKRKERRPTYYLDKTHGHFGQINKSNCPNSFFFILGRKFSGRSQKKTLGPHPFFFLSPS